MAKKLYGTDPDQVPTNADLGTIAYQDKDNASISKIQVENDGDLQLNPDGGKITIGANNFDATSGDLQGIANLYGRGVGSTKTFAKLTFQNSNDSGSSYAQIQGRRIDSNYGTELWFYVNPQGVAQSPTHVMTLQNGGDLAVIDGNVVMANGHGIDFSATGDGSGTTSSELLDDYEEGAWTPTIGIGTTTTNSFTGGSYSIQAGRYTKVGNMVTLWFHIRISNKGSQSGTVYMKGLPFTNHGDDTSSEGATVSINYWNSMANPVSLTGYVQNGRAQIILIDSDATTVTPTITNSDLTNSSTWYGVVTYRAA